MLSIQEENKIMVIKISNGKKLDSVGENLFNCIRVKNESDEAYKTRMLLKNESIKSLKKIIKNGGIEKEDFYFFEIFKKRNKNKNKKGENYND